MDVRQKQRLFHYVPRFLLACSYSVFAHVISTVRPPFRGEENNSFHIELRIDENNLTRRNANAFDNPGKRATRRRSLRVSHVRKKRKSNLYLMSACRIRHIFSMQIETYKLSPAAAVKITAAV